MCFICKRLIIFGTRSRTKVRIDSFTFTSKGGRERNEDSVIAQHSEEKGIFIVADGLGGHKDGDIASQSVVSFIKEKWLSIADRSFSRKWIEETVSDTNKLLWSTQEEKHSNMRSTLALLLIDGEKSAWANVGDSRVYYLRDGEITGITDDHSVAFMKYKWGEILRSDIPKDPDQSRLLRALGDKERNRPDIYENPVPVRKGDAFLLCSDGLWEYLNDLEIAIDYLKSLTAREWGERLLQRVIERVHEGNDNLSLVAVRIE